MSGSNYAGWTQAPNPPRQPVQSDQYRNLVSGYTPDNQESQDLQNPLQNHSTMSSYPNQHFAAFPSSNFNFNQSTPVNSYQDVTNWSSSAPSNMTASTSTGLPPIVTNPNLTAGLNSSGYPTYQSDPRIIHNSFLQNQSAGSSYPSYPGPREKRQRGNEDDDEADSEDDDTAPISTHPNGEVKPKPQGACARCKSLKVKCEFKNNPNTCKRCLNGGHECVIPGRKKRRAPPKRELLLNQIRDQASRIKELMTLLDARNIPSNASTGVPSDISSIAASSPSLPGTSTPLSLISDALTADTSASESQAASAATATNLPDVAAWIAQARQHAQEIDQLASPRIFDESDSSFDGSSEDDDSDTDDGIGVAVVGSDIETGAGMTSPRGNHRTNSPQHNVPLPPSATPIGLIAHMSRARIPSRDNSVEPEEHMLAPRYLDRSVTSPDTPHPPGFEPQILTRGIATPQECERLFQIYFEYMNWSTSLLDPEYFTPKLVYVRSPFLFTVICAVASRFDSVNPSLYDKLIGYAQLAAGSALIRGPKTVDDVYAYILLSLYPIPMRTWDEDRTWLYLGAAIRVATDLSLNIPHTTKPRNEIEARTILNRTRAWLNCFNLDRSTTFQLGKKMTISNSDYVANLAETWCTSSRFNVPGFDVHLACYGADLKTIGDFVLQVYSDPHYPTGLNKSLDLVQLSTETDEKLRALYERWNERLQKETDPSHPGQHWRNCLIRLAYSYGRLTALCVGFQHAFGKSHSGGSQEFFNRCYQAASDVVEVFIQDLSSQKAYLRHGPEAQSVFVTFASSFLVKLLHPKYAIYLQLEGRKRIRALVRGIIDLLGCSEVAVDDRHGPKLWSRFLEGLLDSPLAKEELTPADFVSTSTRRAKKNRNGSGGSNHAMEASQDTLSNQSSPPSTAALSPPAPFPANLAQFDNHLYQASPSQEFLDHSQPQQPNALQMTFSEFEQQPLGLGNEILHFMQSTPDPSAWQGMTTYGFNWLTNIQQANNEDPHMMNTIDPNLLNANALFS